MTKDRSDALWAGAARKGANLDAIVEEGLERLGASGRVELLLVIAYDGSTAIRLAACRVGLKLLDSKLASTFVRYLHDDDLEVRAMARRVLESTAFVVDQRARWR